tara:strand:- start:5002 stop:5385 length:384 start_codon:yes stop_codon:yes gene_type:complete
MVKNTYIYTNGIGEQKPITECSYSNLKKDLMKCKAKFIKDSKRLKAVCDELNRRKTTNANKSYVYHPTKIIDASVGKVFGYETSEEHKRVMAVFSLVASILSSDDFTEEDRIVALQVLQQGMERNDD